MNWWKKLLSHFTEIHIESTSSELNPHLYVSLVRGRYQLSTANAIYSYADLYDNFTEAFKRLRLDDLPGKEVLVLGFGLGSIPYMLEKKFDRNYNYTAVELDEAVTYLASKYTLPELRSPIQIVGADAAIFVDSCDQQFDLIAVDVFVDDRVPSSIESFDFLKALQRLVRTDGLLMFNRLTYTAADKENARQFYEGRFRKVFPEATYLDVKGNWMLLNDSRLL